MKSETKEATTKVEQREPERSRHFNFIIDCVEAKALSQYKKVFAVLVDSEGNEYKHELQKEVEESTNLKGDFKLEIKEKKTISEEEVLNHLPDIFLQISEKLKEEGSIKVHIIYSEATYFRGEESTTYRTMYDSDVKTIYVPSIHKTTEMLEKQLEKQSTKEMNKKGKDLVI